MTQNAQKINLILSLVGIVVAIAAVAIAGYFLLGKTPDIIQGEVEVSEYRVSSKVPGRILEIRVKEGDFVKAGDTLAILEAPEVQAKLSQAEAAKDAATAMSEIAKEGARPEQIQAAYQVWQKAKAGLDIAEKSYNRVNHLFEEGVMSAQKRDEAYANFKAMQASEQAAKSQYDMAKNGARREEKAAASAQVNRAKGAISEVNSYIKETMLIAQMDGEVSEIFPKIGELVGTGAPIMNISMLQDMWGTFNVREDLLGSLKVGQEFTAYVPAFKKELKMKVTYMKDIGSFATWKATKTTGQYDSKTFEVRATPIEKLDGLRPGMSLVINK
ncbi:MAG: biotin/lipoyl-binding protein [Bacteroidaceae bacterium]|nr:biotin/lipoyl-binding protein [Bacteroidaceae bacterium]